MPTKWSLYRNAEGQGSEGFWRAEHVEVLRRRHKRIVSLCALPMCCSWWFSPLALIRIILKNLYSRSIHVSTLFPWVLQATLANKLNPKSGLWELHFITHWSQPQVTTWGLGLTFHVGASLAAVRSDPISREMVSELNWITEGILGNCWMCEEILPHIWYQKCCVKWCEWEQRRKKKSKVFLKKHSILNLLAPWSQSPIQSIYKEKTGRKLQGEGETRSNCGRFCCFLSVL